MGFDLLCDYGLEEGQTDRQTDSQTDGRTADGRFNKKKTGLVKKQKGPMSTDQGQQRVDSKMSTDEQDQRTDRQVPLQGWDGMNVV